MFFNKKNNNVIKCESCGSKVEKKFSFCPFCGTNFMSSKKEKADYGFLGKNDFSESNDPLKQPQFGMFDKLLNSMVNNMIKNIDKQMKDQFKDMENNIDKSDIRSLPNGIKIKISGPFDMAQKNQQKKKQVKKKVIKEMGEEQLQRISKLPKAKAKSNVKRIGDRLVYELTTPGVSSSEDVFISKLESGYEVKAIGDKKVYVNSVPINLPLKKYSILKNKLNVEFLTENQNQF
jgi:hypothetical protein